MPKGKRKGKSGRYIWLFYATLTLNTGCLLAIGSSYVATYCAENVLDQITRVIGYYCHLNAISK